MDLELGKKNGKWEMGNYLEFREGGEGIAFSCVCVLGLKGEGGGMCMILMRDGAGGMG
jgi:hypothetical protein